MCDFFHRFQSAVEVQLARTAIIVEAIGSVGILLCFQEDGAWPDCVHCARIDVDHVAYLYGNPVQKLLHVLGMDRGFNLSPIYSWLESESNGRFWSGGEHVPTFSFSARLADLFRAFVIGMNLHREALFRK